MKQGVEASWTHNGGKCASTYYKKLSYCLKG